MTISLFDNLESIPSYSPLNQNSSEVVVQNVIFSTEHNTVNEEQDFIDNEPITFLNKLCCCATSMQNEIDKLLYRQLCLVWCHVNNDNNIECCLCSKCDDNFNLCGCNKHMCDYTNTTTKNNVNCIDHCVMNIVGILVGILSFLIRFCYFLFGFVLLTIGIIFLPILLLIWGICYVSKIYCSAQIDSISSVNEALI